MNRPTCETCPFWDKKATVTTDAYVPLNIRHGNSTGFGHCRVHSPTKCGACGSESWPFTGNADWCGEHPAFAEWMRQQDGQLVENYRCPLHTDEGRCTLPSSHAGAHVHDLT